METLAYCEKCKELWPVAQMTQFGLHDPNQKVMSANNSKSILLCPDCLDKRSTAIVQKGGKPIK
jgi:hypothetical protein